MGQVTKNLLIINVLVWVFYAVASTDTVVHADKILALHYFSSSDFRPWQLITYMFTHHELWHLFMNMFALVMFGSVIEWALGSKRFLIYYLACGLGAALIQEGVYALMLMHYATYVTPDEYAIISQTGSEIMAQGYNWVGVAGDINALINGAVLGASGAVFGVLLAFGMLFPNRELYIMFIPVPIKAKWAVAGFAVLELAMGVGQVADNVAHFAHLGGMLVGLVILLIWRRQGRNKFNSWY